MRMPAAGEMSGPGKWKGLCETGTRQSPVNLPVNSASLKVAADMGDFDFAYGTLEKTDVLNTGHGTMQVRPDTHPIAHGLVRTPVFDDGDAHDIMQCILKL